METKTSIRVASFNIGDFTTASDSAGNDIRYGSGTPKTLEEYIAVFRKVGADLWGLQEDSEFFFYPEKISPYDALYKQILPNYERVFTRSYNGKAFLSNLELRDVRTVDYPAAVTGYAPQGTTSYGHPWFLSAKITVCDKEITIVSLHLDWSCKEKRAQQLATLTEYAKKQDPCILIGDFNPENLVNGEEQHDGDSEAPDTKNMYRKDWKILDDAGLVCANGGRFGTFGTIMSHGVPVCPYPWDNIVVTPNIKIKNVDVIYEPWMNDHAIVAADLEIGV